ncbi:hypothetical protein SAMN04488508_104219 [Aquimarina spongiae]|uniref:Uncharacterized protein n=1 Tax=Aquimarina spongiae TaxID=570521 RepID=A0A1M6FCZ5_9FLAO|nr:hypothetical protein SAMN04488508_104219 [Aquimarina spongiae]
MAVHNINLMFENSTKKNEFIVLKIADTSCILIKNQTSKKML